MTYRTYNKIYPEANNREAGITLMLAVLVLAGITAVAFSIAAIVLVEIRASGDLLRTEPALYAVQSVTEEAFYSTTRNIEPFPFSTSVNNVNLSIQERNYDPSPQTYVVYYNSTTKFSLADPAEPFENSYTSVTIKYINPPPGTIVTGQLYQYEVLGANGVVDEQELSSVDPTWTINLADYANNATSEFEIALTTTNVNNATVLVTSARTGSPPSGLPLIGRKAYDVTARYLGLTRKYTVSSPTFSLGSSTAVNVAAASNGATVSASSTDLPGYPTSAAIDGDHIGLNWGVSGGWVDGTAGTWPDWLQVDFSGTKTISEIDVFTVQDNYASPSEPTPSMTFSSWGLIDFEVQYWNGSSWVTVPGGNIVGNNLVWRKLTFAPVSTDRIRVYATFGQNARSRIVEVEAY